MARENEGRICVGGTRRADLMMSLRRLNLEKMTAVKFSIEYVIVYLVHTTHVTMLIIALMYMLPPIDQ